MLELERLYNLFGDIAGIALDLALAAASGYLLRERAMCLNESLTSSRLLRSVNVLGGVRKDLSPNDREKVLATIVKLKLEFDDLVTMMLTSPSMMDRVVTTGKLSREMATNLNVVGPAARASGIDRDVRRDHPYAAYGKLDFLVPTQSAGDVSARMKVKMDEVRESFSLIEQALDSMPSGPVRASVGEVPQGRIAYSSSGIAQGELVHWVLSGRERLQGTRCGMPPSATGWPWSKRCWATSYRTSRSSIRASIYPMPGTTCEVLKCLDSSSWECSRKGFRPMTIRRSGAFPATRSWDCRRWTWTCATDAWIAYMPVLSRPLR